MNRSSAVALLEARGVNSSTRRLEPRLVGVVEAAKLGLEQRLHVGHGTIVHGDGDALVLDEDAGDRARQALDSRDEGRRD